MLKEIISTFSEHLWVPDEAFTSTVNRGVGGRLTPSRNSDNSTRKVLSWLDIESFTSNRIQTLEKDSDFRFTVVPDGINSIELELDALLIPRDSNELLVIMHGALQREKYVIPRFEFKKSVKDFQGSVLFIADPTLNTHDLLTLSWYVGTEIDDGHQMVAALVNGIAAQLGAKKVVLAGSSGGGFAAIAASIRIPNSVALAFSPQTSIERYYASHRSRFISCAFPNWSKAPEKWTEHAQRFDLTALYAARERTNRVYLVQNTGDEFHMKNHCVPFAKNLGLDFSRGIFSGNGFIFDCRMLREGHRPPSADILNEYIDRVFKLFE